MQNLKINSVVNRLKLQKSNCNSKNERENERNNRFTNLYCGHQKLFQNINPNELQNYHRFTLDSGQFFDNQPQNNKNAQHDAKQKRESMCELKRKIMLKKSQKCIIMIDNLKNKKKIENIQQLQIKKKSINYRDTSHSQIFPNPQRPKSSLIENRKSDNNTTNKYHFKCVCEVKKQKLNQFTYSTLIVREHKKLKPKSLSEKKRRSQFGVKSFQKVYNQRMNNAKKLLHQIQDYQISPWNTQAYFKNAFI